jgi:hypothetical protein
MKFLDAHLDGSDLDHAKGTARLHFQPDGGDRLVVTIPLYELEGLRRDIDAALALDPTLFARG